MPGLSSLPLFAFRCVLTAGLACTGGSDGNVLGPDIGGYTSSQSAWEMRADAIRHGLLSGADLRRLPERTPLHATVAHERHRDGYTVSDVSFEASENFRVFGNLYKPDHPGTKAPAILVAHGHFKDADFYARARPENQILCARLAQLGAVVFTYDMVGWGEATQVDHNAPNVLQLQLWDSIRAVDYLQSLPFVDPNRIGVTGASGGATQALYLSAVDPRIKASVLVAMISSKYTGHERCEDGMPVHDVPDGSKTNNVEIAATFAPRPILFVSDGADWTKKFPQDDFPLVQKIYGLYGASAKAFSMELVSEKHDYGPNKRQVAYQFFARELGLPRSNPISWQPAGPEFDGNPERIRIETEQDQSVLSWVNFSESSMRRYSHRSAALILSDRCDHCFSPEVSGEASALSIR